MSHLSSSLLVLLVLTLTGCTVHRGERDTAADIASLPSCGVVRVHDGDTVWVRCSGVREKIRLHCIDAPELAQAPWGTESRDHLRRLLVGGSVGLQRVDTDRYGRTVARLWVGQREITERMVEAGWAVVYPTYCPERWPHHAAEATARESGQGLWQSGGLHQTPWVWRAAQRK